MSDNKTVPSAETILKEKGITGLTENHNYQYLHRSILEAMHKHTRLHLEAMLSEITSGDEKVLLKRDIEKTGNNYISNL